MPSASFVQTNFLGGEWSAQSHGRMDHPRYRSALAIARNHIIMEEGNAVRRSGFRHAATTHNGLPGRLMPFKIPEGDPLTMELTDEHLRFFNGLDLETEEPIVVSDISTATPAVVTISAPISWATDDQVQFTFGVSAVGECPLLTGRQFRVEVLTTETVALYDPITGSAIDGSLLGYTSGFDISIARIANLSTPYTTTLLPTVRRVQNDDGVLFLSGQVAPYLLTGETPLDFSLDPAVFQDGPYLDPLVDVWATPDALNGLVNLSLTAPTYSATKAYSIGDRVGHVAVDYISLVDENVGHTPASSPTYWAVSSIGLAIGGAGFQASDVGRMVRLFSEPADWVSASNYGAGSVVKFNNTYWVGLASMTGATPGANEINPNQPGNLTTTWQPYPNGGLWTWGVITAIEAAGLSGLIDPLLSGSVNIGDMTNGFGLAAAFDSATSQTMSASARQDKSGNGPHRVYCGKDYSGASPQNVIYATVYPPTDTGWGENEGGTNNLNSVTINLYASQSAPTSTVDGTLLGTTGVILRGAPAFTQEQTIFSNDPTTQWNYIWFQMTGDVTGEGDGIDTDYGFAEVRFFGSAPDGITVQIKGDALLYTSAIRTWRIGAYSDTTGWPRCGCWHEGRLWLGGAIPNRFDASVSNDPYNFRPTNTVGAVADNDAINYTFNSAEENSIFWMVPNTQGILAGTQGGEFVIRASANENILTPTSVQAKLVTETRCANIEPQRPGQSLVFVQLHQRKLMEYLADSYSGNFYASNLSEFAKHLSKGNIWEIAYQSELAPVVWCCKEDGSLAGATYKRVSMLSTQPPEFIAWHSQDHGAGHTFESIAVGASIDGGLDGLAVIVHDPELDIYHVEVLDNIIDEQATIYDAQMLDGGIVPSSGETVVDGDEVYVRFHGLWALNGKEVTVFAAGLNCGVYAVANGRVDVLYDSAAGGLFTQRYLTQLSAQQNDYGDLAVTIDGGVIIPAVVGFAPVARGQLLRPVAQADTGAANGPGFAKTRRQHEFGVLLHNTQDVSFGTDFDSLRPVIFETPGGRAFSETELFSGIYSDKLEDGYTYDSQLCWEASGPFPLSVLAIGGFIQTQDK